MTPGIPAFQQDWTWPTSPATLNGWLQLATLPWNWNGLGSPQVYPFADYLVTALATFAIAIGAKAILLLYLSVILAVAGAGMGALARILGIRSRLAISASIVTYSTSPVLFNKLAAGHMYYLIGYALLPTIIALLARLRHIDWRVGTPVLALTLAASISQAQFIVFDFLALACWLAIRNRRLHRREVGAIALAALLALTIQAYPLVGLVAPQSGFILAHQHATIAGVASESVSIQDLLMQDGYPPGYFRRVREASWQVEWAALATGSLAILGWLSAIFRIATQRARNPRFDVEALVLVGAIFGIGAGLVLGLNGPAAPLLAYVFVHVAAASILKELYHVMVLVSLGYAAGIAISVDLACGAVRALEARVIRRTLGGAFVVAGAFFVIAALPMLEGSWLDFVGLRDSSAIDRELVAEPSARLERYMFFPVSQPIRAEDRTSGGGNDSDAQRPWQSSSIYMGAPDPALAYLETAVIYGPEVRLDFLFRRFGLKLAIGRKHYVSAAPEQRHLDAAQASLFDPVAIGQSLSKYGLHLSENDDTLWSYRPDRAYQGLVLAGTAPVAAGDDFALADQDLANLAGQRDEYVPEIFSADLRVAPPSVTTLGAVGTARTSADWMLPAALFVDLSEAVGGFDPDHDWTSTQDSYLTNRWQNFSPVGAVFTRSPTPFGLAPGRAVSGRFLAVLVASDRPQRAVELNVTGTRDVTRLVPLATRAELDPEHFTWYRAVDPLTSDAPLRITFSGQQYGVAVAAVAVLSRQELDVLARKTPGTRGSNGRGDVRLTDVGPVRIAGWVNSINGSGTCSLSLLTNFDRRWSLQLEGAPQLGHFRGDGWTNGWLVPCGRHSFVIKYAGQAFTLATTIGWGIILLCITVAIGFGVKTRAWLVLRYPM